MGSFTGKGRDNGPNRRRDRKNQRREGFFRLESLESRTLLSVDVGPVWHPTNSNLADVQNGPMANLGQDLVNIYQAFESAHGNNAQVAAQFPTFKIQNSSVMVDLSSWTDFEGMRTAVTNLGMQVVASSSTYQMIEGWLPISALPTVAQLPQTLSGHAIVKTQPKVGTGVNEGDYSLQSNLARLQTSLNGTGIKIGVISDSYNNLGTAAADVTSGDLPSNVQIIQDLPSGGNDEGRAMLQLIYDIAPGASLAFATGGIGGNLGFANNVTALVNAGCNIIVDDLGPDEPFFQPGLIQQAIDAAVAKGVVYVSAAGNTGSNGYASNFRVATGNVAGVTNGRFMNFDPNGGTALTLPVTTTAANTVVSFQFDQPYNTEQPNKANQVTSQLNFFVLDGSGNVVVSGTTDNTATQSPSQLVTIPNTGSYSIAIQLVKGAAPDKIQFLQIAPSSNQGLQVPQTYGSAGGTFYPTTFGHASGSTVIGVGAVPWWATTPFLGQSPLANEPFSSTGPVLQLRDANGAPLASPLTIQNPVVSGPDGSSTTFFGFPADTTNPPFPGQPATGTNLYSDPRFQPSQTNLPAFFGTSAAAPNVAAVVALMLQRAPTTSPDQIRTALIASASPMNGTPAGQFNTKSGFGFVNAIGAINNVDTLRVATTSPANGEVVTSTPSYILVTFNKPVQFSTISASNLVFTSLPAGVASVNYGTPQAIDNAQFPTQVAFPFSFVIKPGQSANGAFTFAINGSIVSQDGKAFVAGSPVSFTLNDTTAPQVTTTSEFARLVRIQFSKALNPATVTAANVFVTVDGVNLNNDPRFNNAISYDAISQTVTLNYAGLPQTAMPSGNYQIHVTAGVTDLVGNPLDGEFSGSFPSGNGTSGGDFVQNLGFLQVQAPTITAFQLTTQTDTGISGDGNTSTTTPAFVGQVFAPFPGTVAGVQIYAQFNGLHPELNGGFSLGVGTGGIGYSGSYDINVVTDANGAFILTPPTLPEGFNQVELVAVGQSTTPNNPLAGPATSQGHSFRIDVTAPNIATASLTAGGTPLDATQAIPLAALQTLYLNVNDTSNQAFTYLSTPSSVVYQALDPSTATNISNYSLLLVNADGSTTDQSRYIATATFTPTTDTSGTIISAYTAQVALTFKTGLPAGKYIFTAHTKETVNGASYAGLLDAAGNPLNKNFSLLFQLQSQPVYVTSLQMQSSYNGTNATTIGGPRSYYELPSTVAGYQARAQNPPTAWVVDLSNPIPYADANGNPIDYASALQLIGSADPGSSVADGNFGDLGQANRGSSNPASGFTVVSTAANSTVVLQYQNSAGNWVNADASNPGTRLVLRLNSGTTLAADYYRIYMSNEVQSNGTNTIIKDVYGNQLDGEFLGDQTASGAYETLLPTGQYRAGLSGDGIGGGAFMTSFVVVRSGNILYARPGYQEDSLNPSSAPDGSLAKPYAALAPEGNPSVAPLNPNHDPNGGLNDRSYFQPGKPYYDRNADGVFTRSAFYAASQLSFFGPVVIVALPGTPQRDPISGAISQSTFVMQAPAGSNQVTNNGSASVPAMTTLAFAPGSTLKLSNASLFVQNQGAAIQALGGNQPSTVINFTSFANDTVGGDNNHDGGNTTPKGGDWGGLVLRNVDTTTNGNGGLQFPVDGSLKGTWNAAGTAYNPAVSGADDALSVFNFASISYGGGNVPQTIGEGFDGVQLYNSRPAITNTKISYIGGSGSSQAAISANLDSFREDDTARGLLVRRVTVLNNNLNGIWVRPEVVGLAEATNAQNYVANPTAMGNAINYTFDDPLPYILTSQLIVGNELQLASNSTFSGFSQRMYVQPGMMFKSQRGAWIDVLETAALNVGDRAYITNYDLANSQGLSYGPLNADNTPNTNYRAPSGGDAGVLFTSLYDDSATTSYFDPIANATTTVVPAIPAVNQGGVNVPQPGNVPTLARWGGVTLESGARSVVDEATFQYGGGFINGTTGSQYSTNVLFYNAPRSSFSQGAHAFVTNNNFYDNQDAAMAIDVNGLLAGDALTPLNSGHPFFRGNVLGAITNAQGTLIHGNNDINGLAVLSSASYTPFGIEELFHAQPSDFADVLVSTVWDTTDLPYVVRGTIVLGPQGGFGGGGTYTRPLPSADGADPFLKPSLTLTIQSALPGALLANGQTVPRPGESVVVKMLNDPNNAGLSVVPGDGINGTTGADSTTRAGAGFIVGVDDGIDPPTSTLLGSGLDSQLRIIGIPGNETNGQQRVPAIMTSLLDSTVPLSVRGVDMSKTYAAPIPLYVTSGLGTRTTPNAGDGGLIYFGSKSLTDPNLLDPRDGNLIADADIRYMTRIEVQGGGVVDVFNTNPGTGTGQDTTFDAVDNPLAQSQGIGVFETISTATPPVITGFDTWLNQFNSSKAMTFSNSNFANFSSTMILAHPGPDMLGHNVGETLGTGATAVPTGGFFRAGGFAAEPVVLNIFNNTFANAPTGVRMNSNTGNDTTFQDAYQLVLLNNTFYNTNEGLHTQAPEFAPGPPPNTQSNVYWLAMDNIFVNNSTAAIHFVGQQYNSTAQYNLFWNDGPPNTVGTLYGIIDEELTTFGFNGNYGAIVADPLFRNAAAGDFRLTVNSPAVDAARSEIGPFELGNVLAPITSQPLTSDGSTGLRNRSGRLGWADGFFGGLFGGGGFNFGPSDLVSLPGNQIRTFEDQFVPVQNTTPNSYNGGASNGATYNWVPISGVRDAQGYLRVPTPGSGQVGFGSHPFYDLGPFEFRQLNPPEVTGVTASFGSGNTANFYTVGGVAVATATPQELDVKFNSLIDPTTISSSSVQLFASGGDGVFGNGNSPSDGPINLSGKLSFNSATQTLVINLAGSGLNLATDKYRLYLLGNGSDVLRNPQGLALDGENTVNNDPNGAQLALPSGDGFPGGNFYLTFVINASPPTIKPGTFQLSASSDTNLSGDLVTTSTTPTFTGTITVTNPTISPVASQVVVMDVGVAVQDAQGNITYYFGDAGTTTPANLLPYIRPNAGSTLTDVAGAFAVSVGQDGASTGLVSNTSPLADSPYNVGSSGKLVPIPGTVSGFYVARVRINPGSSSTVSNDVNSLADFVVDTTDPTVAVISPQANTVLDASAGAITFQVQSSENLDLTKFSTDPTTGQIQLLKAGANGSFANGTVVPLNTSIGVTYLDAGSGGSGRELLSFGAASTLTNGLYQLTLKTGTGGIQDIAGNPASGGDVVIQFAVFNPSVVTGAFVGNAAYVTDPSQPQGDRANPFPTISAAVAAASVGDTIRVLPGVYTESVTMRQFVSIVSADPSSTNSTLVRGNALKTIIRAPATFGATATVIATDLTAFQGASSGAIFQTEIAGLTIASALLGDPAIGVINTQAVGLLVTNSSILIDRDYFVDSGSGIQVVTTPGGTSTTRILNDALIGNINGILITDPGSSGSGNTINIINNTFAYNTYGIYDQNDSSSSSTVQVANNIFWQNHSQSASRAGYGIFSAAANKLLLNNNMFSGNGTSDSSSVGASNTTQIGFNPGALGSSLASAQANRGNFIGYPSFVSPRDPRPGSDGPANFFLDANFGLSRSSPAINNAAESLATKTDILGNAENANPTTSGFGQANGYGPRDVGAFEYLPLGSLSANPVGGSFRVVTTSMVPDQTVRANGSTLVVPSSPNSIIVAFSTAVNSKTLSASALSITGSGVNSANPVRAISVTWIDAYTAQFNLTGQFNPSGTVNIAIAGGTLKSMDGQSLPTYSDQVNLSIQPPAPPAPPSSPVTQPPVVLDPVVTNPVVIPVVSTPVSTPAPAPAPSPIHRKPAKFRKPVKKAHKPAVHKVAAKPKKTAVKVVKHPAHKVTTIRRTPPKFAAARKVTIG